MTKKSAPKKTKAPVKKTVVSSKSKSPQTKKPLPSKKVAPTKSSKVSGAKKVSVSKTSQQKTLKKSSGLAVKPKAESKKNSAPAKKATQKVASKTTVKSKASPKKTNTKTPVAKVAPKASKSVAKPSQTKSAVKKVPTKTASAKSTPAKKVSSKTLQPKDSPKKVESKVSKNSSVKTSSSKEKKSSEKKVEKVSKTSSLVRENAPIMPLPAKTKKNRGQRIRPSQNISFSLDDLDLYLARKQSGAFSSTRETVSSGTSTANVLRQQAPKIVTPAPKRKAEVASIFDILGFNPVEAPTREKVESKDIPRKWKKYYNKLMELRKHHSQGIESRVEEVHKRSSKEDSGDLSSQEVIDAGSESFERDMAYNLLSAGKEVLVEIDEAVKRIKNGTYGICEITGKPIPEERLMSIPFTRYSKEGQERKEVEQRRIKNSQRSMYEMPTEGGSSGDDSEDNS